MSIAAMTVIAAFLIIMGSFYLLAMNVESVIQAAANDHIMVIIVDEELTDEQARLLRLHIHAVGNVEGAEFIHRDQALEEYRAVLEAQGGNLDGVEEGDNPLRHRYLVSLADIEQMRETRDLLAEIPGIATIRAPFEIADTFGTISQVIGVVSVAMIALLMTLAVFVISNTVKLATMDRREEIAIMRVVGATNTFIRWPFIVEGFLLGTASSGAAFALQWWLYNQVAGRLTLGEDLLTVLPFAEVSGNMLGLFLAAGFLVGVGGSGVAIRKFLKV